MHFLSVTANSTKTDAADIGDVSEEESGDTERAVVTRIIEGELQGLATSIIILKITVMVGKNIHIVVLETSHYSGSGRLNK